MKHSELERAWPAAEPPPGFADRVLERLQQAPAPGEPRRSGAREWLRSLHVRWLILPAAAAALGGIFQLLPARPEREGDVIAAEPRVVSLGSRAVAELSSGAHVRWSGDEVQQDRGAVIYRVEPGAAFRVQTPHGSVTALGTVFRVVLAGDRGQEGEPMKKRWAIAGGSAALGALLWVSVERGSVRLSNGAGALVLGAGQSGSVAADGVPRLDPPAPEAPAQGTAAVEGERARARAVADAVRRHAARRREALAANQLQAQQPPVSAPAPAEQGTPPVQFSLPPAPPATPRTAEEQRRRDYLRHVMHEQYFPVARSCYEELLGREPTARGKVVLEFAIVGDGDAGVIDRVALREDETTLHDPEFTLCMRESLYTAVFEPPPSGANETTVVYPIELRPD